MNDYRGGVKRNVPHRLTRHVMSADATRLVCRHSTLSFLAPFAVMPHIGNTIGDNCTLKSLYPPSICKLHIAKHGILATKWHFVWLFGEFLLTLSRLI